MKFSGLTKKGRVYLAKCQAASTPIQFTKIKFGDGKLTDNENPADLTDIKNIKVEKSILSKEPKGDAVVLTTIIDNVSLGQGYFPRETGIYVLDEGVEILYFYMNDGDETSWIPPEADGPHRMEIKINLISSNTGSVIVHNDGKDLYITKEYLEANYTQKGEYDGTAQSIEDRVVAAVGKEDGKFPLTESMAGNIYYFPGNKKFYYCLKSQTSRVSVPNADFEELSIYQNRKKLENLSTFKIQELYSTPAGVKFTIFQYGSLILIAAYTYGTEKLNYGTSYKCNLPYDCYNTATAITGNNASSGQFNLVNNILIVNSTDNQVPLKNTFMGQLTTFLK
ncbi:phage tail protein [Fusobacterium animalis]|uniref:phage tail protein n=1 Tax=Fusobacterium animalis TaxID=76859 RepID=UPI0021636060|nr:phage tail protein [Fusobacterium animalis]